MAKKHHKPAGGFNTRKALKPFLHSDYGVVQTRARKAVKAHYRPKKVKRLSRSLGRLEHAYSAGTRGAGQDITDPLTPHTLKKEINSATRVQYGPSERDLKQQFKENTYQQRHAQDWYGQYQQQLKGASLQQAGFNAQAQGFLGSQAGALGGMDAQVASQQQAAMQADAAKRGAQVDPSVGKTAYAALLARQQGYGNFQGLNASQGQTAGGYLANQQAVGGAQAIGTLKNLLSDRKDLTQKRSDLRREEGDYKTKYRGTLRDSERSYLLERKAFGLNVAKAQADVAQSNADRRLKVREDKMGAREAARKSKQDARKAAQGNKADRARFIALYGKTPHWFLKHPNAAARLYAHRHRKSSSSSSSSHSSGSSSGNPRNGLGSLTQNEENSGLDKLDYAVRIFRRYKGKTSGHQIRQYLESGYTSGSPSKGTQTKIEQTPTLFINAAEDIVYRGGLSKTNQHRLRKSGYHIHRYPRLNRRSQRLSHAFSGLTGHG